MLKAAPFWTNCFNQILDVVYPRQCPLCQRLLMDSPCLECRDEFERNPEPLRLLRSGDLSFRAAIFAYRGRAGQAARRLKYSRCTSLVAFLSLQMKEEVERLGLNSDFVVPVPIHWSRRAYRGFNQSELLCEGLSPKLNVLHRVRRTRPQVGLSDEERRTNLSGAFRADASASGRSVLLIDDVLTSGQTARECARALIAAGAAEVGILALCGEP